jgi:hypothetical protein
MSAIITFKSAEELAIFVKFAAQHKLDTVFPMDEDDAEPRLHFHHNGDDLEGLVNEAFNQKLLTHAELEHAVLHGYLYDVSPPTKDILVKPSAAFKHFCGGEYCNKQGLISLAMIRDCVLHYANPRKLWDSQVLILDGELQTVLGATETRMTLEQLDAHCLSVFLVE